MIFPEAKLIIKKNIVFSKVFYKSCIDNSFKNFGKIGEYWYKTIVREFFVIISFEDRDNLSNFKLIWYSAWLHWYIKNCKIVWVQVALQPVRQLKDLDSLGLVIY